MPCRKEEDKNMVDFMKALEALDTEIAL